MPQQSLALVNSEITISQSKVLAKTLSQANGENDEAFARAAFSQVLGRPPRDEEIATSVDFLASGGKSSPVTAGETPDIAPGTASIAAKARARENLVLVLFNHHDFVTIR